MRNQLNVLLTGHNGYIGSVMAPVLESAGHRVTGLDTGYFSQCTLGNEPSPPQSVRKDLRELEAADLEGFDAVVHLAALSNDPIGNLNTGWTEEINYRGSVLLAELAKSAGVKKFLFSSSCIMYGVSQLSVVNEESPLDPKTEYAASKVKAEESIRSLASKDFSPVFLRNGTVYGLSPRMRFDTVLNDLVGAATATGKVTVYGGGKQWRPVVHVEDVSRAFLAVLEAPRDAIHNQAFNLGADEFNTQVGQLAEFATAAAPGASMEILNREGADQRTYWTEFRKFAAAFPGFKFLWNPERGARQLYEALSGLGLTYQQFTDKKYTRLKWLNHLLQSQQLDGTLRWAATEALRAGR